jgi:para-aminobenzoate synthetase component I
MALLLQSDQPTHARTGEQGVARGRFDIITAAPEYWLETHDGQQLWRGNNPPALSLDESSSLSSLHRLVDAVQKTEIDYTQCLNADLPFCGGLIGYCSYDLARETIKLEEGPIRDIDVPDMQFGFYGWACIQDHQQKKSWLIIHPDCDDTLRERLPHIFQDQKDRPEIDKSISSGNVRSEMTQEEYSSKFEKIQEYINSGDCYQVNLSQRFTAGTDLNPVELYKVLRNAMPSPFCAFLPVLGHKKDNFIISLSPERFIKIDTNKKVISQPIKGTSKRNEDNDIDEALAADLQEDKKNRSENLMIVDLLRNDLGRVCKIGTIEASNLFELQSFSNVHHLVSTIQGDLEDGLNGVDVLKACFPGGSITGAPKIRAMEIINELEQSRRSIYCGNIAYFSAHGTMDSSIMIRTVLLTDNKIYCWGGGGIVSESNKKCEYAESITKVKKLLDNIKGGEVF